jgi:XTP/dITP diphosphohydrolase
VILLATRSAGKLRELRPLFERNGFEVVELTGSGIDEDPIEDGLEVFETFEENALAKARYFAQRSGLPTIADDSGLEVIALGGRPGVRTKRFSGRTDLAGVALDEANNAKLITELSGVADRRARYVCAAAFVERGKPELVQRGATEGVITLAPRGDGGFGYDPYFESSELRQTFGEADADAKERVSHRGRAFRALIAELRRG